MSLQMGPGPEYTEQQDWDVKFAEEKAHIDELVKEHHPFAALQYIMTSFFSLLSDYNESYRMGSQATIENVLSKLQQDRNAIEADFDANQTEESTTAAQDALDKYKDIEGLLSKYEKKGIFTQTWVTQVEQEFVNPNAKDGTIFQGQTTASDLAKTWNQDWQGPSGGNPPKPSGSPAIQGVTNALSAVSTDFSSQSSIAESKLKYYETWDEEFLTVQRSMMSNFVDQEKSPNTSMQSAAS